MPIDWPELIAALVDELDGLFSRIPDGGWQRPGRLRGLVVLAHSAASQV